MSSKKILVLIVVILLPILIYIYMTGPVVKRYKNRGINEGMSYLSITVY